MLPRKFTSLLLSACLPLLPWLPASVEGEGLEERCRLLERELPGLCQRARVPGISLAIASAEGVQWLGFCGVRDARDGAPIDAQTIFEAASLSKPVFAYAVLQLVDQELLELDTPLVEYAPLADIAHDARHEQLTARMVLSHSTGLPNWRQRGGRLEFTADPGAGWIYSGEGFVLLQQVVEQLVGDTLQGLAQSLVFEPLGMDRTSFVWKPEYAPNVAHPHDADGASREYNRNKRPNAAYSLLTTASDYATFLAALMRAEGLSPELRAALLTPFSEAGPGVSWGLGIGLEQNPDGLAFWHWGHNSGYRAYALGYPSRDEVLVYFTNSDNGMRLLRELVRLATGDPDHPAIDHLDYPGYDEPKGGDTEEGDTEDGDTKDCTSE